MVWRQLPKLVPAGSIPVSCSKRKGVRRYSGGRLFVCSADAFSFVQRVSAKNIKNFRRTGSRAFFVPSGML